MSRKDIAARWAAQYRRGKRWKYCHGDKTSKQIHAELVALGPHPEPEDIERIIGNDTWTSCNPATPKQAAPPDPGIKPNGIRDRALRAMRPRLAEAA
jgi:hypothetical protein